VLRQKQKVLDELKRLDKTKKVLRQKQKVLDELKRLDKRWKWSEVIRQKQQVLDNLKELQQEENKWKQILSKFRAGAKGVTEKSKKKWVEVASNPIEYDGFRFTEKIFTNGNSKHTHVRL
jgi:hypothetical protein